MIKTGVVAKTHNTIELAQDQVRARKISLLIEK